MSIIYKICDGNDTVDVTITMEQSALKLRQFTIGDSIVTEQYYTLTFTASQPLYDAELRINYQYEYRERNNPTYVITDWSDWSVQYGVAIIPAGQQSVEKDVMKYRHQCNNSGDSGLDYLDEAR